MKLLLGLLTASVLPLVGQSDPTALKHLSVPTLTSVRPISVAALDIERQIPYPALIHLKGGVEIKTPICLAAGKNNALICSGYVVLRADEADLHEDSGQIDARGKVVITREK